MKGWSGRHPWYSTRNYPGKRPATLGGTIGTKEIEQLVNAKYQAPSAGKENGADLLVFQLTAAGVGGFLREHRFCPRKFAIDVAFPAPDVRLAVEVDGFGRGGELGAHQTHEGITSNCEKSALLAIYGWRLMRVTTAQVKSGDALKWIEAAVGTPKALPEPT